MSLEDKVKIALQDAMRARDAARTSALRMIRAALIEAAKSGQGTLTDAMVIDAIRKVRKQRIDSADTYASIGRQDLADLERAEALVADEFLPSVADEAQTEEWTRAIIAEMHATGPREAGKVMGALMKSHRTELDPKLAKEIVERELAALAI